VSAAALRIAALHWEPYALPFAQPFASAGGRLSERRGFILRVQDEAGAWGVGEAAPLPAFGGESLERCEADLRRWAAALPGREVALPADPAAWAPAAGLAAPEPAPCACHALECALLDLAARRAGLPLARWLDAAAPAAVALNATLGAGTPAQAAAAAREAVSEGYATLKLKVGLGAAAADAALLRAVREAVGAAPRLRIDANGAWRREDALERLRAWAPLDIEYAEQPVPAHDVEGLAWLAARSPVPVAADESIRGVADAQRLLERRAAAVLVLKPMLLGGPLTTLRIARTAHAAGVPVVVTTVLEGIYGRLAALHCAAAVASLHRAAGLSAAPPACGLATGALLAQDLLPAPPAPAGGRWELPAQPGLGLA
jgi:o-succinylbenzoate synthase